MSDGSTKDLSSWDYKIDPDKVKDGKQTYTVSYGGQMTTFQLTGVSQEYENA